MLVANSGQGNIRPIVESDVALVLKWRNHLSVRQFMFNQHEISYEEHRRWFELSLKSDERHLLIVEKNGVPFGFVNFNEIVPDQIADWGFYRAPDAERGTGQLLALLALKYAFEELGLHKICGRVIEYNDRSIRFHVRQGFNKEGVLREQYFDGESYHSIICFGLLVNEWKLKTED